MLPRATKEDLPIIHTSKKHKYNLFEVFSLKIFDRKLSMEDMKSLVCKVCKKNFVNKIRGHILSKIVFIVITKSVWKNHCSTGFCNSYVLKESCRNYSKNQTEKVKLHSEIVIIPIIFNVINEKFKILKRGLLLIFSKWTFFKCWKKSMKLSLFSWFQM